MNNYIEKDFKNKLTKKDYFLYLVNRNTFITISPLIILALIVVFIFMVNQDGFQFNDVLYLLPILLFVLSYIQMNNAIKKAIEANAKSGELKVILNKDKYKEITASGENFLEYTKFHSYYESKNYYYLYVDKINALILPKREFTTDELSTINNYFQKSIRKTPILNLRNIFGIICSVALITCMIVLIISMI